MSFLYNLLFGKPVDKSKSEPTPSHVQSIQAIAAHEAQIEKKLSYTRICIQQLVEDAKGCMLRNEKAKALACLKQKGLLEEQEKSYVSMLEKLTQQRLALEMNMMQRDTLHVIQQTNTVFQGSESTLDTEKAQEILDTFEEKLQTQQEITQLITQPLGNTDHEQQAEEELQRMMQEIAPAVSRPEPMPVITTRIAQEEPATERIAVLS